MSRVDMFKCDVCGATSASVDKWARLTVTGSLRGGDGFYAATQGHVSPEVVVSGKLPRRFTTADLCSRDCAARFLFGEDAT